jgi:hypothetical protein
MAIWCAWDTAVTFCRPQERPDSQFRRWYLLANLDVTFLLPSPPIPVSGGCSCDIATHKTTSPYGAAIFLVHTLALPSDRNVNYIEKQLNGKKIFQFFLYLYRFSKYMSYSFPIINPF